MLSVVTFKWAPHPGYRSTFGPETVKVLRAMVARHYQKPHRFICITDDPTGLEDIETIPIWDDYADIPSPHGGKNPSCYRRLKLFSSGIGDLIGPRFVSLDLDVVICGDLSPLWDRPEDFVMVKETNPRNFYNGSMWLMSAGARPHVWDTFDPKLSPRTSLRAGRWGSDQGWISHVLGPNEAKWSQYDGVYSFRNEVKRMGTLPKNAKVVIFHGAIDPWSDRAQAIPWIQEFYRVAA